MATIPQPIFVYVEATPDVSVTVTPVGNYNINVTGTVTGSGVPIPPVDPISMPFPPEAYVYTYQTGIFVDIPGTQTITGPKTFTSFIYSGVTGGFLTLADVSYNGTFNGYVPYISFRNPIGGKIGGMGSFVVFDSGRNEDSSVSILDKNYLITLAQLNLAYSSSAQEAQVRSLYSPLNIMADASAYVTINGVRTAYFGQFQTDIYTDLIFGNSPVSGAGVTAILKDGSTSGAWKFPGGISTTDGIYYNKSVTTAPYISLALARLYKAGSPSSSVCLDWNTCKLFSGTGGGVALDWDNLILSGNWKAQNISINNSPVATQAWVQAQGYSQSSGNVNTSGFLTSGQVVNLKVSITSGVSQQGVQFAVPFSGSPMVTTTFINDVDQYFYSHFVGGISTTGFWVYFSDVITTTGYCLGVIAKI